MVRPSFFIRLFADIEKFMIKSYVKSEFIFSNDKIKMRALHMGMHTRMNIFFVFQEMFVFSDLLMNFIFINTQPFLNFNDFVS